MPVMKYFFLLQLILFSFTITAQKNDSLPKQYQQLQQLITPFFISSKAPKISQKENISAATTAIINIVVSKSTDVLSGEGFTFGNTLHLPEVLQLVKDSLVSSGNGELLNSFHQSLQKAAASSFEICLPHFTPKAFAFNIDELLKHTNGNWLSLTDLFASAYKNALLQIATPFVSNALKTVSAGDYYKKLVVAYKNIIGDKLKFNYQDAITEEIVNRFLAQIKTQEALLKQNPSSLLNKLEGQ
jgi:hypothetical protein